MESPEKSFGITDEEWDSLIDLIKKINDGNYPFLGEQAAFYICKLPDETKKELLEMCVRSKTYSVTMMMGAALKQAIVIILNNTKPERLEEGIQTIKDAMDEFFNEYIKESKRKPN